MAKTCHQVTCFVCLFLPSLPESIAAEAVCSGETPATEERGESEALTDLEQDYYDYEEDYGQSDSSSTSSTSSSSRGQYQSSQSENEDYGESDYSSTSSSSSSTLGQYQSSKSQSDSTPLGGYKSQKSSRIGRISSRLQPTRSCFAPIKNTSSSYA